MESRIFNWAIIGLGYIANKFAEALSVIPNAKLYAVASQNMERAQNFANKYNVPFYYDSYDNIYKNENVDIIYIATTNNFHFSQTISALNHKKAVLCEKPATLSTIEMQDIIETANRNKTFYMEAMWTRFLPTLDAVEKVLSSGKVGELQHIIADFGISVKYSASSRLFDKNLGGGSIYDIGIYPIFLALHFFGKPNNILASQKISESGVDISTSVIMNYKNGKSANLFSSFDSVSLTEAKLLCTKGCIKMNGSFHTPTSISIYTDESTENISPKYESNGYSYEAREVMDCLSKNLIESPRYPHCFSLTLASIIEQICHNAKEMQ